MKFFVTISIILTFSFSVFANKLGYSKKLKFIPSRGLSSSHSLELKGPALQTDSLISMKGHKFDIKPINKQAIKSFDLLISIKILLN